MTQLIDRVSNVFQTLDGASKAQLLVDVCHNMLERKDWDGVAKFLVDQLGEGDVQPVVLSYANKKESAS